jgi:hypothetical protein
MRKYPEIRTEEILLLGLCRNSFNAELRVMLMALAEETNDWDYFCMQANNHGISALVYNNLVKLEFTGLLPVPALEQLRNSWLLSLNRNTFLRKVAGETIDILNRNNIKVVLLKGLALEETVYGSAGLRQMSDVDVLTDSSEVQQAYRVLLGEGFKALPLKSVFHKPILAHTGKHLPTLVKDGFHFELHHDLFGPGRSVLTSMLFKDSYEAELNGIKVYMPLPQLFFLYLVRHLYHHELTNESQLRLYADLVIMLGERRDEIINLKLIDLAMQAGMEEVLAWKLEPLRDLWGLSFPGWLDDFIDKNYNPSSINKFVFFLSSPKNNPPGDRPLLYRQRVLEVPGFHRKLLFVLGDIFPSLIFMKKRYGCKSTLKALLYYPHRFGKLWYLLKGAGKK